MVWLWILDQSMWEGDPATETRYTNSQLHPFTGFSGQEHFILWTSGSYLGVFWLAGRLGAVLWGFYMGAYNLWLGRSCVCSTVLTQAGVWDIFGSHYVPSKFRWWVLLTEWEGTLVWVIDSSCVLYTPQYRQEKRLAHTVANGLNYSVQNKSTMGRFYLSILCIYLLFSTEYNFKSGILLFPVLLFYKEIKFYFYFIIKEENKIIIFFLLPWWFLCAFVRFVIVWRFMYWCWHVELFYITLVIKDLIARWLISSTYWQEDVKWN